MTTSPRVIAICGRKRSGKDTVASFICDKYGYSNAKFAEPLKASVQGLFGFSDYQLEVDKESVDAFWGVSPREVMQFFGAHVVQYEFQKLLPGIGRSFFIKSLLARHKDDKIVISDLRFQHEFDAIKAIPNAIIFKLIRPSLTNEDNHISEREVDEIVVPDEFLLENNGSVEALLTKVDGVLARYCT